MEQSERTLTIPATENLCWSFSSAGALLERLPLDPPLQNTSNQQHRTQSSLTNIVSMVTRVVKYQITNFTKLYHFVLSFTVICQSPSTPFTIIDFSPNYESPPPPFPIISFKLPNYTCPQFPCTFMSQSPSPPNPRRYFMYPIPFPESHDQYFNYRSPSTLHLLIAQ